MKCIATVLLALVAVTASASERPNNIIMVIGDGMGPAVTTGYRFFADNPATAEVESTVFDRHLVGMASTHPDLVSGYVTDSAASATALSSGIKTYNGAIAVDINKKPTPTVLQHARKLGKRTGIAVTSQINHATPASYAVHNESRKNYNQIADSYFDDRIGDKFVLDVMLGGGWQYFIRDDRNLVEEFERAGYHYADDITQLQNLPKDTPVLGLFADTGLDWTLDMDGKPRLLAMTQTAVKQLENDKGYFLLVEASQVDWAEHGNDIASAMHEMHDLALTLEWLEQYVKRNPDTLVVITADHSTGGLTLAAKGEYKWDPTPLKGIKASPRTIAQKLMAADEHDTEAESLLGFALSAEHLQLLKDAEKDERALFKAITQIIDDKTNTGWTTSGHTAVDVQVFAMGAGKGHFAGHIDNTEIPKILRKLLDSK